MVVRYGDLSGIGKIHTYFMKYILNVKKSTPHVMLYDFQYQSQLRNELLVSGQNRF